MEDRISQALQRLFEKHRIVFWYDTNRELRSDYEALSLDGVEKVELRNNEFGLKYRMLRQEPAKKFLLYKEGPQPEDPDNWLLDVQLAQGVFRTDQTAIWLSEMELGMEFMDVIREHAAFFQSEKRKQALKKRLEADDTASRIRVKMLSVCAGSDPRIDSVMEHLLSELSEGKDEKMQLVMRCGLDKPLWEQLLRHYGYKSDEPGLRDFVIELFKSSYAEVTGDASRLTTDAQVFLKRWKDSRQFAASFERLSEECAEVLSIEQDLLERDFRDLIELDIFELIDKKIISDLVREMVARTISNGDVAQMVRQRRQSHWYDTYRHPYEAIEYAARFISTHGRSTLAMDSLHDGIARYSQSWFRLDQYYRKFFYHVRRSGMATLTNHLAQDIENLYSNNYLLKLNDQWQEQVDRVAKWDAGAIHRQQRFYDQSVKPFLTKGNKLCVIISDAMRYEIADELLSRIQQEDRYNGQLEPVLSVLPSYTQLGMAALLPNQGLEISGKDGTTVTIEGQSTAGHANRKRILNESSGNAATAV